MPSYHTLLDRLDYLLTPDVGIMAVVDFYTSGKEPSTHEKGQPPPFNIHFRHQAYLVSNVAIGGTLKQCGWISRWFWQIWFDFDHVDLSPGRRDYLEYRFGTVRTSIRIPFFDALTLCDLFYRSSRSTAATSSSFRLLFVSPTTYGLGALARATPLDSLTRSRLKEETC